MPLNLSILDAARNIVASPAPVLLLDTCALVDIIRAPRRNTNNLIMPAVELTEHAMGSPTRLYVLVAPLVPGEWKEHSSVEKEKLEVYIRKINMDLRPLRSACGILGINIAEKEMDYISCGLPDRLFAIAARLYNVATLLHKDDTCRASATERAIKKKPPARKGTINDSDIVEHYLAVCHQLGLSSFSEKVVFASSNTKDFCEPGGSNMHAHLLAEFSCVDFGFANNLAWAKSALDL